MDNEITEFDIALGSSTMSISSLDDMTFNFGENPSAYNYGQCLDSFSGSQEDCCINNGCTWTNNNCLFDNEDCQIEKIYLLHSPNERGGFKGLTEAKKLKKIIEPIFGPTELVTINAFEVSNIYLIIREIVVKEVEKSGIPLIADNFAVGITGGTNPMACGAILGAFLAGVTAYYVRNKKFEPNRERYVEYLDMRLTISTTTDNETREVYLHLSN